ncbi:MAG TPA: hypothetical protein VGG51_09075 [Candidatus Cybelea sp.]|jgi:hypothetical protein
MGFAAGAPLGAAVGPGAAEAGGEATVCEGSGELFAARPGAAEDRGGAGEAAGSRSGCERTAGEGELCGCGGLLQDCRQSKTKPM